MEVNVRVIALALKPLYINSLVHSRVNSVPRGLAHPLAHRVCSMFAELCSVARIDHPQPSVEYFLSLHQSLKNAVAVSDALSKARNPSDPAIPTDDGEEASNEKARVVMEKSRSAASWVNAALTSDLATFSIQSKQGASSGLRNISKRGTSQQLQVMLDHGPSTLPRGRSSSPSVTTRSTTLSTPSSPKSRTALSSVSHIANEKRTAAESRSQSPVKLEPKPSAAFSPFYE